MTPQHNGLIRWRKQVAENKRLVVAELDALREHAVTETYEGREYMLVRIPDRYGEPAPPSPAPVVVRRRLSAWGWR